jgi:ElaB/YqjD/DUF883 family membrane-anchored ribosome-binding protein
MNTKTSSVDDASSPSERAAHSIHAAASARGKRGAHAVRARIRQARENAQRASQDAVSYVKNEPMKALLIAVAVGAVLSVVVGRMARSRNGG